MTRIALAALMLAAATPALAQTVSTAPPKVAAPPAESALGPPLPGVCMLSQQDAINNSKIGQAAAKRVREFIDQATAQYKADKAPVDASAQALQAQVITNEAEYLKRAQALQTAAVKVEATREQRGRQIDALSQQVTSKIVTSWQPLLKQVYVAHHCSLLLDRNSVLGGNMSGDLTPDLIASMDAYLGELVFDLPPLPAAAAAPAAPAPAATPATSSKKKK